MCDFDIHYISEEDQPDCRPPYSLPVGWYYRLKNMPDVGPFPTDEAALSALLIARPGYWYLFGGM